MVRIVFAHGGLWHELWRCKAVANDFHAPMDGIGTSITGSGVRLLPLPFYTNGKLPHLS